MERSLPKRLEELTRLHDRCRRSRSRYWTYDYLAEVFRLYRELRRNGLARTAADYIARLEEPDPPAGTHAFRVIIDATSNADIKDKIALDAAPARSLARSAGGMRAQRFKTAACRYEATSQETKKNAIAD